MFKANTSALQKQLSDEQIRSMIQDRARRIYEKSGRSAGRDLANWLEAEKQVKRELARK